MDLNIIKRLVKLVETSDIEELEIKEEGFQVRITRGKGVSQNPLTAAAPHMHSSSPVIVPPPQEPSVHDDKAESSTEAKPENVIEICSPMVGTFYRAPAPDASPYVEVGDVIQPGKVLCIVEAMKLMNEIEAEVSGKIIKILAENAQPVEYNHPLFLVETS
jgi:acetyl-CoA carboxylase biotin carboxyl carrier protein